MMLAAAKSPFFAFFKTALTMLIISDGVTALLNAARISFNQKKDYAAAYSYYQQLSADAELKENVLEAAKGMMYCASKLNRTNDVASAANVVLSLNNASNDDQTEAHFYLGKVALTGNDLDKAFTEFSSVSQASSSMMGAEAAYHIAEIYFKKDELKQAENQSWDVIKKKSGSDYWIAKSYLLIADIYEVQGDHFQSKATLQSVIDNYKGNDDIIPSARKKMEEVKANEAGSSKVETEDVTQDDDSSQQENPIDKNQH